MNYGIGLMEYDINYELPSHVWAVFVTHGKDRTARGIRCESTEAFGRAAQPSRQTCHAPGGKGPPRTGIGPFRTRLHFRGGLPCVLRASMWFLDIFYSQLELLTFPPPRPKPFGFLWLGPWERASLLEASGYKIVQRYFNDTFTNE